MKQFNSTKVSTAVIFATIAVLSCSSDIELPPSYEELFGSSSSLAGVSSSSSSLPSDAVFCRLSDGTCPLTQISQEACATFGGTPVQSCAVSSSSSVLPSSSSVVPSSSSVVPSSSSAPSSSSFAHIGKGNNISNYSTIAIGTQTWMAENLDYVVEGSKCYNNDPARCNEYGSLYDWSTAMALPSSCNSSTCSGQIQSPHRGICPSGWHIPSQAEWNTLSSYVQSTSGCSGCDAKLLKSTSGWSSNGNGTNQYGFSALPGGLGYSDGSFNYVGNYGYWWSANESVSYYAYRRIMYYSYGDAGWSSHNKSSLFSVRCVQD